MKLTRRQIKKWGYEEFRDFFIDLGNWAYRRDFTYQAPETWSMRKMIATFLRECKGVK